MGFPIEQLPRNLRECPDTKYAATTHTGLAATDLVSSRPTEATPTARRRHSVRRTSRPRRRGRALPSPSWRRRRPRRGGRRLRGPRQPCCALAGPAGSRGSPPRAPRTAPPPAGEGRAGPAPPPPARGRAAPRGRQRRQSRLAQCSRMRLGAQRSLGWASSHAPRLPAGRGVAASVRWHGDRLPRGLTHPAGKAARGAHTHGWQAAQGGTHTRLAGRLPGGSAHSAYLEVRKNAKAREGHRVPQQLPSGDSLPQKDGADLRRRQQRAAVRNNSPSAALAGGKYHSRAGRWARGARGGVMSGDVPSRGE